MNEQLRLSDMQHANNIANLSRVEELVRAGRRIDAADLLMRFRQHERARLAARASIGCAHVPSPHEARYVDLLCAVRVAILVAMQGESEVTA